MAAAVVRAAFRADRNSSEPVLTRRIEAEDDYFDRLSREWGRMLHEAVHQIPNPPFMEAAQPGPDVPQIRAA